MKRVIALGARNSKASINKKLASYVASKIHNVIVEVLDLNDYEMPIYGIDLEHDSGIPETAYKLLSRIQQADGLVISLAEHNGVYSVAFKNVFDWMSRIDGKLWNNIPMLLLSTSPGARGGATVLEIATNRFSYMGGNIVYAMSFPSFFDNYKDGKVVTHDLNIKLQAGITKLEEEI